MYSDDTTETNVLPTEKQMLSGNNGAFTPVRPPTFRFNMGGEGLANATHNVIGADKLGVTLELTDGTKLIINGDVRSLFEVLYVIVKCIESATRRAIVQAPHAWTRRL